MSLGISIVRVFLVSLTSVNSVFILRLAALAQDSLRSSLLDLAVVGWGLGPALSEGAKRPSRRVPGTGVEPARVAPPAPKTGVSAVPPPRLAGLSLLDRTRLISGPARFLGTGPAGLVPTGPARWRRTRRDPSHRSFETDLQHCGPRSAKHVDPPASRTRHVRDDQFIHRAAARGA